jgi:hypothetical protein
LKVAARVSKPLKTARFVGQGMPSWSLLSGSPRVGESVGAAPGLSSDTLTRHARVLGVLSSVVLVWAAAGLLAALLDGQDAVPGIVVTMALLGGGAALLFLLSRGDRRLLVRAAAALATLAIVLAVAGHLLHARGASLRFLFPPAFGDHDVAGPGILALLLGLLLIPLAATARLRTMSLGFDASGADARTPVALWRALAQRGLDDAPRPARAPLGALLRLGEAWLLPGMLALDLAGSLAVRASDALSRRARDRLHVEADLVALAYALQEEGWAAEPAGNGATLRVRNPDGGVVLLRARALSFPDVEARRVLDITGKPADLRRLRRLLEGPLCAHAVFAWSRVGRRIEARLNALIIESGRAGTLEERGLLLEESERLERALGARELSGEEWTLLATWKLQRLRAGLVSKMLAEPPGARPEHRVTAPAPTLTPPLARVMDAGGLSAMRRAVFVPHWVVPVHTPWGERDVVVNALTGRAEPGESRRLLDAMRERAPTMLLEMGRPSAFLPAPVPTAALLREMRGLGGARPGHLAAIETFYVPFVPGPEGYVNAVTGTAAPDLGAALPVVS